MTQQYLETTHHSVNWFLQAEQGSQLEIAPSFQRRPVWSSKQKSDLIGTMLLGYPIPELYVHEIVDGDGGELYRLVDGQQRIRAALEFVKGEFALEESPSVPSTAHNKSFDELDETQRKAVRTYKLVVRTLKELDEAVVKEMFRRLNQGVVSLNDQELRHATYEGAFLKLVESVADRSSWADFGLFSADDVRRMRDVEYVSELAILTINGPQNKKLTLDRWYQTYEESFGEQAALEFTFDSVLTELQQLLPDLKRTRWRKRSDFYSLFGALVRQEHELPFSNEERIQVGAAIRTFGDSVDLAVRLSNEATLGNGEVDETPARDEEESLLAHEDPSDLQESNQIPPEASRYADAVERAATDLSRRRIREAVLVKLIHDALNR